MLTALHAVGQLVETLHHKLEGSGFDSRWYLWKFSLTEFFRSHYGSWVDSVSNGYEQQDYLRGR